MGLNMDVDHVAFASTRKFDGFQYRQLNPAELGQVAGRAGRYMNDGTFGVTGEADPFDNETIERLESHNFDSVRMLQWRNRDLDFASLDRLSRSLTALPQIEGLTRAQPNADLSGLEALARDPATRDLAKGPKDVERLWEVCQIPDYRNISNSEHASIVRPHLPVPADRQRFHRRGLVRAAAEVLREHAATSTRCRTASAMSAPGPSSLTVRTGSRHLSIGNPTRER